MKFTINLSSTFLVIILAGFSCKEDDKTVNPPISQYDMNNCHKMILWDALKINNALIGEWNWEWMGCFWTPENAMYVSDQKLIIEFKEDSTLVVRENDEVTQLATWHVIIVEDDLFGIDVEPGVQQLYGIIRFCGERVEFNNSFIDGCDNYFVRK